MAERQGVFAMKNQLPKHGPKSQPSNDQETTRARETKPDCPASRLTPRVSLQDGTLPGPPALATARASRPSAPVVWPASQTAPARDVLLCAIGALLMALAYVYW